MCGYSWVDLTTDLKNYLTLLLLFIKRVLPKKIRAIIDKPVERPALPQWDKGLRVELHRQKV
jgi:hypothetical protein